MLVLAAALCLALNGTAQNTPAPSASVRSSVAVVDVDKILKDWKYVAKRFSDLELSFQPKIDALKARDQAIEKEAQVLNTMTRGTADYQQTEDGLIRKKQAVNSERQLLAKQLTEQRAKIVQDAYKYIKSHAEYYARQRGASCVVKVTTLPDFQTPLFAQTNPFEATSAEISMRQVLWFDGSIDITDTILTRLNAGSSATTARSANGAAATTATQNGAVPR